MSELSGIITIAAGGSHSLALKKDGTVWAWGGNGAGQLGDGTWTLLRWAPVQVWGLTGVTAVPFTNNTQFDVAFAPDTLHRRFALVRRGSIALQALQILLH